ncbi:MAG: hypothetical protein ACRD9R_12920 [Pyrinomonadaceae bacterium]
MKSAVLVLLVHLFCAGAVSAQVTTHPSTTSPADKPSDKRPPVANERESLTPPRQWAFYVTLANVFDSNVNRDEDKIRSFGAVGGVGLYYRNRAEDPTFEFNYEVGQHRFSGTDRWNRTSHKFLASHERELSRRFTAETTGEISLKGSTEDRDLTDSYNAEQVLEYRITRRHRLNLSGVFRHRRYEDDPERNAINLYAEGGYEQRLRGNRSLEMSYRYETNDARSTRHDYIRRTFGAEFTTPLTRGGRLQMEARYRPRSYISRLVEVDDDDREELRRDRTWTFGAEWRRPVSRGLELGLLYHFETRSSNDPDRNYKSHLTAMTLTYRWWR